VSSFNVFETKPRLLFIFDPEHFVNYDREQLLKLLDTAAELAKLPGFRGCLPCAASGFDENPWMSRVLPAAVREQG
jgi:hypothetical protein